MTLDEAAMVFVNRLFTGRTLRNEVRKGTLKSTKKSGRTLTTPAQMREWIKCPDMPKGPRLYLRKPTGRSAYYAILDTGGVERSTSFGPGQLDAAEKELARYVNSKHIDSLGSHQPSSVVVCDVLNSYVTSKSVPAGADSRRKRAQMDLTYIVERLSEFWDAKTLADVKKSSCQQYLKWRTGQRLRRATKMDNPPLVTASTARRELEVLRAAIHEYHSEYTLDAIPQVTMPPKGSARIRWLTRQEAARALLACLGWSWHAENQRMAWVGHGWNASTNRFEPRQLTRVEKSVRPQRRNGRRHLIRFIIIGVYTGSRAGAIMRARWIPSPSEPFIDVQRGLFYRRGWDERVTNKRQPTVRLPERLLRHMRRWQRSDEKLGITHVVHFGGKPVSSVRTAWEGLCADAGLEGTNRHTLRHTSATWLMQGGMPLSDAADFLGMTEEILRENYYHFHPDFQTGTDTHFAASRVKQANAAKDRKAG